MEREIFTPRLCAFYGWGVTGFSNVNRIRFYRFHKDIIDYKCYNLLSWFFLARMARKYTYTKGIGKQSTDLFLILFFLNENIFQSID
jgi:hypothetical protein